MTKTFVIVLVVVSLLTVGGYLYLNRSGGVSPLPKKPTNQASDSAQPKSGGIDLSNKGDSRVVELKEQKDSNQTGRATLTDIEGKYVDVKIELSGNIASNAAQPAHIVSGTCSNPGLVKYPLSSVVGGKGESLIVKTLAELKKDFPLALVVYKSIKESEVSACIDLSI